jgi:hypothetical protein
MWSPETVEQLSRVSSDVREMKERFDQFVDLVQQGKIGKGAVANTTSTMVSSIAVVTPGQTVHGVPLPILLEMQDRENDD